MNREDTQKPRSRGAFVVVRDRTKHSISDTCTKWPRLNPWAAIFDVWYNFSTMSALPIPPPESIVYEDAWLYVCLALYPITKGHTIVVWKGEVTDLHNLSDAEYDYLMSIVDVARDSLLRAFDVEKVYLMYMDEARQVHWHLVPRYDEKGFNIFMHSPERTKDFSFLPIVQEGFFERIKTREINLPK